MTTGERILHNWVAGLGSATVAFAVPHFVDDFLYGVPAEFGLTNPQAQALGGLFFGAMAGILVLAGRGNRAGLYGSVAVGLLLASAVVLKHLAPILAPVPYWGGALSEVSILGLGASSLGWAIASVVALQRATPEGVAGAGCAVAGQSSDVRQ